MIGIITNFGPGFGPLVRTFEMAIQIYKRLETTQSKPVKIIVPWVYGHDQLRIMKEEIYNQPEIWHNVFLSLEIGNVLRPLLFSGGGFNQELDYFLRLFKKKKALLDQIFKLSLNTLDMNGKHFHLDPLDIQIEVARNPVVSMGIEYSYYSSISYNSLIFEELLTFGNIPGVDYELVEKAISIVRETEVNFRLHFQPFPRCLSFKENYKPLFKSEIETPPLIPKPNSPNGSLESGMYVSVTGISGLRPIYDQAFRLTQSIITNHYSDSLTDTRILPPRYIAHTSVGCVFARAAWNTVWLSNLTGTPLVCPKYTNSDHPEIFFNLKTISKLDLAYIWDNKKTTLENFLLDIPFGKQSRPNVYDSINQKFGTLDGIDYCSKIIVEDFLNAR